MVARGVGSSPAAKRRAVLAEPSMVQTGFGVAFVGREFVGGGAGVARDDFAKRKIVQVLDRGHTRPIVVEKTVVKTNNRGARRLVNGGVEGDVGSVRGYRVGSRLKSPSCCVDT